MKQLSSFRARASAILLLILFGGPLAKAQSNAPLEKVLDQMDLAGKNFSTTEAKFVWNEYKSVVKDTDTQEGKIYFRRAGDDTQMAVDITAPYPKYVVLTGGKLQLYEPKVNQVTVYNLQKNHSEFESFLVLGFGGGGHSMLKSFEVSYLGTEKVEGVEASKLDLIPKTPKVQQMFPHIVLWIDPARGISVRQQLFQGGGDYRLAIYSDIRLHQKIADNVFKLKTDAKTKVQIMSSQD
jgi:outer membrane lipoprotein-sorting protein